ncbi:MAG: toll/interleukin-1 receptor domain-containing protein [Hyphomonadaceae bacterium]
MPGEIFISYRRVDQAKATLLYELLKERGVDAWYDALLDAGDDWRHKTAHALVSAPIFVLLFSKAASESDDISKELAAATFQKKTVIPVRIENILPEGAFLYELASRNWVDAYENTEAKLTKLADNLAALVKGGPQAKEVAASLGARADLMSPAPAGKPLLKQPAVIGGAVAFVVAAAAGLFFLVQPKAGVAAGGDTTTALFAFTTSGDDPALPGLARTATEEAFRQLTTLRIGTGSTPQPTGADEKMIERAAQLGASFAVSGEIRREGDKLKSVTRLFDVGTKAVIGERRRDHPLAQSILAAYAIGSDAGEMSACVWDKATSNNGSPLDVESRRLIGKYCSLNEQSDVTSSLVADRELVRRNPDNGRLQAGLASEAALSAPGVPATMRAALEAEGRAALAAAERLAPHDYVTAAARAAFAIAEQKPPAEWAPALERELQRPPGEREAYAYSGTAVMAGLTMMLLGRNEEAANYFEFVRANNPVHPLNPYLLAIALASSSKPGADTEIANNIGKRMNLYAWEVAVVAAIFLDAGDPETVFAATQPENATGAVCYREVMKALHTTNASARKESAKRVDRCLTEFNSPHVNIMAQAALGNVDRAFAIADRPDFTSYMYSYFGTLFLSPTRPMRADARFLPLMEKLGYVDYWKQTKTKPDICGTPEEKGIPLCKALAR